MKSPEMSRMLRFLLPAALIALSPIALARADDCKEEILTMIDRSTMAGPYRTNSTITANERLITVSSEIVPPDDLYSKTIADNLTREVIKVGARVWVNEGQGWREGPAALAARIAQITQGVRTVAPNLINDAQCPGRRIVDGRAFTVYTYRMDAPGGRASSSNTLYVDPDSRLPARLVVDGLVGRMKSRSDMSYVYDASIKIEPPKTDAPRP